MAERTWEAIELPILEAVRQAELEYPDGGDIVSFVLRSLSDDIDESTCLKAIDALLSSGHLDADVTTNASGKVMTTVVHGLGERGRQEVGQSPSTADAYTNLLEILEQRIATVDDPGERSKLETFRDDLYGIGQAAAGSLLGAFLKSMAGL